MRLTSEMTLDEVVQEARDIAFGCIMRWSKDTPSELKQAYTRPMPRRTKPPRPARFDEDERRGDLMAIVQALADAVTALTSNVAALKTKVDALVASEAGSASPTEQATVAATVQAQADAVKAMLP